MMVMFYSPEGRCQQVILKSKEKSKKMEKWLSPPTQLLSKHPVDLQEQFKMSSEVTDVKESTKTYTAGTQQSYVIYRKPNRTNIHQHQVTKDGNKTN